jgi:hypothetical protein
VVRDLCGRLGSQLPASCSVARSGRADRCFFLFQSHRTFHMSSSVNSRTRELGLFPQLRNRRCYRSGFPAQVIPRVAALCSVVCINVAAIRGAALSIQVTDMVCGVVIDRLVAGCRPFQSGRGRSWSARPPFPAFSVTSAHRLHQSAKPTKHEQTISLIFRSRRCVQSCCRQSSMFTASGANRLWRGAEP